MNKNYGIYMAGNLIDTVHSYGHGMAVLEKTAVEAEKLGCGCSLVEMIHGEVLAYYDPNEVVVALDD